MKSTKFRLTLTSRGVIFEIWSHRRFRGLVYRVEEWIENVMVSRSEASYTTKLVKGWRVEAADGTIISGFDENGIYGSIFKTRRKAAIRLLTDHRFSANVYGVSVTKQSKEE